MSRRDYITIATAFAESRRIALDALTHKRAALSALDLATFTLADALASDNPRFDRERFYAAASYGDCGQVTQH